MLGSMELSPAEITAGQNHHNPTGVDRLNYKPLSSDAARSITGFAAPSPERPALRLVVNDNASSAITLKHEDTNSTDANRIIGVGLLDLVLYAGEFALLTYNPARDRWVILGSSAQDTAQRITYGGFGSPAFGNVEEALDDIFERLPVPATTSVAGVSELATDAETETGTDTGRVITPAGGEATYIKKSLLTTRGDIIYRNATVPARLPKGTSGQVLPMDANDPTWATPASGGWTEIVAATSMPSGGVSITSIPSTYSELMLILNG